MKMRLLTLAKRKLSIRVSVLVVLIASVLFLITLMFLFNQARKAVHNEAISRATLLMDEAELRMANIMASVEVASNMNRSIVMNNYQEPDSLFILSKAILTVNPDFYNCSVAFKPYFYQKYGHYLSVYAKREGDSIRVRQGGSDAYRYYLMDWYLLPMLLDRPIWTEPYVDVDVATGTKEMVTSYAQPLKDNTGQFIGVINISISLSWLSKIIEAKKPYPNSYVIMMGRGGNYFVHPDSTKLTCQTILTGTLEHPDPARTALGQAILRGEEGMRDLQIDGQDCYVIYKPIGTTGWSVAIVCPESDIFGGYERLKHIVIVIVAIGVLMMLCFFFHIITRELKPLHWLAQETKTIASGQFDTELPDFNRIDEIGQLSQSFGDMQQSLISYIEELKETTATKAAIDNELKIASDIQMSMLPSQFPPFPERKDIDLYASMTPAKEVGGDLYNFLLRSKSAGCKTGRPSNDDCLYFALGDVSGKGVPASLFMAQTTRLFRTLAGEGFSPEDIANRMNSGLCEGNDTMMFVTLFIGLVHLQTGQLEFCNCGHNAPLIDGQFLTCKYKNIPLGLFDDIPFKGESIDDIRGKQLLVYTDGLNEAMNREGELLGNERLQEIMAHSQTLTASQVVEMLKEAVEKHRDGAEPNDDLTLLCLRIKS